MEDALGFLGILRKANTLLTGEENTGQAVRAGKAKLILLASDASDNAGDRAGRFAKIGGIGLVRLPYTKQEISQITGRNGCSMAVITDFGFARAFAEKLVQQNETEYAHLVPTLNETLCRVRVENCRDSQKKKKREDRKR